MKVSVKVNGLPEAQKTVDGLTKGMRAKLQKATKAGAMQFKPAAKAAAQPYSRRLARSVSVRQGKRDRPSSIVVFRPKVAWFRHFIIGGTRDHGPRKAKLLVWDNGQQRARRVRGVPPHPILERVFAERQQAATDAMAEELFKE